MRRWLRRKSRTSGSSSRRPRRGADRAGSCRGFSTIIADLLGKDYLHVKVDWRWKNADEVMQGIRTSEGGIPWYAILDADGKVLATSDGPDGNVGFPDPHKSAGIAHFLKTLRETAQRLTEEDLGSLKTELERR